MIRSRWNGSHESLKRHIICFAAACLLVASLQRGHICQAADGGEQAQQDSGYSSQLCGSVCVKIVLKRFGIDATMEEAVKLTQTTIDGTTMLGLKQAFQKKGLYPFAARMSIEDLLKLDAPAIVFVEGNHFMVIDGAKDSSFIVIDYPKEPYLMPATELSKIWNGETLAVFREKPASFVTNEAKKREKVK